MQQVSSGSLVILFDGVCNLCNGFVNFLIDQDPEKRFKFASLQSEFGQSVLTKYNSETVDLQSVIVISNEQLFSKSKAIFLILNELPRWRWLRVFRFLPSFLLNAAYDLVAKNRYRIFGKQDACRIPTPELRERFLG